MIKSGSEKMMNDKLIQIIGHHLNNNDNKGAIWRCAWYGYFHWVSFRSIDGNLRLSGITFNQVKTWISDNLGDCIYITVNGYYIFRLEEDAMAFKLMWS